MSKENKQIRSYARISGIAGLMVYVIYLFAVIFPELLASTENPKLTSDTALLGFLALGFLFAWYKEYEGGIMLMFITLIVGLSYYYNPSPLQMGIVLAVCIPLFMSGLLFYMYHRSKPKEFNPPQ
ncbi:MAG: hypothetical protein RQ761_07515 [Bacteroidales bacterium]|nr:hypothetical protein [Bacteroidales bacterium]